ncbi:hypothetical protein F4808DRAFT_452350 [Astrocystis sublimbata]|nr:hypothetical protein F4808DRAFT_452350 [Astrocystis sublimbata]
MLKDIKIPTSPKLQGRITSEMEKPKWVHAEMNVLIHLLSHGGLEEAAVPYLGVSKKTCYLCGHVIRQIGGFGTRGNHGKIYPQWTLPSSLPILPANAQSFQAVVENLQNVLHHDLHKPVPKGRDAEKESLLAAPISAPYPTTRTLFTESIPDPGRQQREAEFWQSTSKRVRTLRHQEAVNAVDISQDICPENPEPLEVFEEIAFPCEQCRSVAYCDTTCRRAHAHIHKFFCNLGRPIDAADYLVQACQMDEIPDEDTAKAFGFCSFPSAFDRKRLFGIYSVLIKGGGPMSQRGLLHPEDLTWIKNQSEFRSHAIQGLDWNMAKHHLREEDQLCGVKSLTPRAKRRSYVFYTQMLHGFGPAVTEDNWLAFGYCTAPDNQGLDDIQGAYATLIQRCQFEEFWNSLKNGTLIELFDKYGLENRVARLRNLRDFMSRNRDGRCESVWELKRGTDTTAVQNLIQVVMVDYCFSRCNNALEGQHLKEMYQDYFSLGLDEMLLHKACISGTLASFLEGTLGQLKVPHEALENDYPLEDFPENLKGMVVDVLELRDESVAEQDIPPELRQTDSKSTITIPARYEEDALRFMMRRTAFLGTGIQRRTTGWVLPNSLSCTY